jgi:hypothetical protein
MTCSWRSQNRRGKLRLPDVFGVSWIRHLGQDGHAGQTGNDLLEKLLSLLREIGADQGEAGDIAAWAREAGDYPCRDRVDGDHEYRRDRPRGVLSRHDRWRSRCDNYIDIAVDQFGCGIGELVRVACQPVFDAN